jgi:hypothetical protein
MSTSICSVSSNIQRVCDLLADDYYRVVHGYSRTTSASTTTPLETLELRNYAAVQYVLNPNMRVQARSKVADPENNLSIIIPRCLHVENVAVLNDIFSLTMRHNRGLVDVSGLTNVKEVDLVGCIDLVDVSALGTAQKLNLRSCTQIVDVSALGHVRDLNLTNCRSIWDVSELGKAGMKKLNLEMCRNVGNVSSLGNVENLNLSCCNHIYDVSMLGNVKRLDISFCNNIVNVLALRNAECLNLSHSGVRDISALTKVRKLDISYCNHIRNYGKVRTSLFNPSLVSLGSLVDDGWFNAIDCSKD